MQKLLRTFVSLGSSHSNVRRVIGAALNIFFWLMLARLIGAAKEVVIAYRYGTSPIVDGYLFVFNTTFSISTIWSSIAFFALIPLLNAPRAPEETSRFVQELFGLVLAASLIVSLIAIAFFGWSIRSNFFGLSPETLESVRLASVFLPLGLTLSATSTILLTLAIHNRQHASSLSEGLIALGTALVVLFAFQPTVYPLVYGTLGGFLISWLFLAVLCYLKGNFPKPRFNLRSGLWREFARIASLTAAAQCILVSTNYVDLFFVARLGEGALSTYNYAYRVAALFLTLPAAAISRALLPIFSQETHTSGASLAKSFVRKGFAGGLVVLMLGWLAAETIVRIIYERGAFSSQDTAAVSSILKMLFLQIPIYASWIIMYNWWVSRKAFGDLLRAALVVFAAKVVGAWALSSIYGLEGVAASTAVMYLFGLWYTFRVSGRR